MIDDWEGRESVKFEVSSREPFIRVHPCSSVVENQRKSVLILRLRSGRCQRFFISLRALRVLRG